MIPLTDNHRYFIQYMLKKGVASVNKVQKYCEYVTKGDVENLIQLKTLLIESNREISKQSFRIVFFTCEVTNQDYLVWINTKNDDISKLQGSYSALELEYFRAILQELLNAEEHRITFIVCLNITSSLSFNMSRENGQQALTKFIKTGYFVKNESHIYLGPRIISEFTSYLKTYMQDSLCSLCSELVFWGKTCASCNKTVHGYCLEKYLQKQENCPNCHNVWNSVNNGGEELTMDVDEHSQSSDENTVSSSTQINKKTQRTQRKKQSQRSIGHVTAEEDISESGDLMVPGPSRISSRRKRPFSPSF